MGARVGFVMGGEVSRRSGSSGARLLVLRAEECSLCLSLDVVEGVFEQPVEADTRLASLDVVDWCTVAGLDGTTTAEAPSTLVVVRTPEGPIGLAADACLGVRDFSLVAAAPVPTLLVNESSHPLCYLLIVEGQPYFLLEPGALVRARERSRGAPARPTEVSSAPPSETAVGG